MNRIEPTFRRLTSRRPISKRGRWLAAATLWAWALAGAAGAAQTSAVPEDALDALRSAAESGPLDREAALQLAAAEIAAGRVEAAVRQLTSVVERFDSARALLDLARLEARRGHPDRVRSYLRRALEIAPNAEEPLSAFARSSLAAREPVPAIRALEPLNRMHPTVADYPYLLGIARLQIGENEAAVEALERSLELAPDRPQTLVALGLGLNSQKRFERAREVLRQSLSIEARNGEALAALAEAEEGLGAYADAEGHAREALALIENHAGAHLVLGRVRMNQRRYEEARDELSRAVAADPTSAKAHYQLSLAYTRLGDTERSEEHLELYRESLQQMEEYVVELRTEAGLDLPKENR